MLGQHSKSTFDFPQKAELLFYWAFDGNLGVRFFFVLSGFLITYLLLKEHVRTGTLSFRSFYARRALRILPVYFGFLAVVLGLQVFTPAHQSGITWLANLTFTTNFVPRPLFTFHLWTLAIEEQFYFLWPVILYLSGLQNTHRILRVLVIPVVISPICKALSCSGYTILLPDALSPFFEDFSSFFYFDSLAIGCMAAVLYVKYNREILIMFSKHGTAIALTGATFILGPYILEKLYLAHLFTTFAGNFFQAIGFAMLLLQSIFFPRFFKPLNWAITRQIGVLSYSIYIWHMLFCSNPQSFGLSHVWFMSFRGWLVAVFLVATVSYYCLEKPVMALRERFRG